MEGKDTKKIYLIEIVRYMEVTRAQLPIGREKRNKGCISQAKEPSNNLRDLEQIELHRKSFADQNLVLHI